MAHHRVQVIRLLLKLCFLFFASFFPFLFLLPLLIYICYILLGKVAVSWLKIVALGLWLAARILSHESATLPFVVFLLAADILRPFSD